MTDDVLNVDRFKRPDGKISSGRILNELDKGRININDENIAQLMELIKNDFDDDPYYELETYSKIQLLTKLINKASNDGLKKQALSSVYQICNETKNDSQLAIIVDALHSNMKEASKWGGADVYLSFVQTCLTKDYRGPKTNSMIYEFINGTNGIDVAVRSKGEALKKAWLVSILQSEQGKEYVGLALGIYGEEDSDILHYVASQYPEQLKEKLASNKESFNKAKKVYSQHPEFFQQPFDKSVFKVHMFAKNIKDLKIGDVEEVFDIELNDPINSFNSILPPRHLKSNDEVVLESVGENKNPEVLKENQETKAQAEVRAAEEVTPATSEEQRAFDKKITKIDAVAEANPMIDENGKFSWMAKWVGPKDPLTMVETNHPDMEELNAFYDNIVDEDGQKHEGLQSDVYELALAATKQELAEMEGWENQSEEEKVRIFQRTLANNITATTASFVLMQEDANKGLDPQKMDKPAAERMSEAKDIISKFATDKSKPYMVTKKVLATMMGTQVADVEQRAQKLSERFNNSKPVQWIKGVDDKFTKRWPNLYPGLKQFAKGYAVTGTIAALTGPAGLAVYAGYNVYKQAKAMKDQANANGQTFWQFIKDNKSQAIMLGLSAASASMSAIVGIDALGNTATGQWLGEGIKTMGKLQGIAAMGKTFSEERKKGKSFWDALKSASARGIGTWVAVGSGLNTHESIVSAIDSLGDNNAETVEVAAEQTGSSIDPKTEVFKFINGSEVDDMNLDVNPGKEWQQEQTEMMKPVEFDYERANEIQLDRLLDANPKDVNELLNDGKWHSSAELHQMMENGELSAEQVKSIHGLANDMFDKEGHITDNDLKEFYEKRAAKAELEAQQAQAEQTVVEQTPKTPVVEGQENPETPKAPTTSGNTMSPKEMAEHIAKLSRQGVNEKIETDKGVTQNHSSPSTLNVAQVMAEIAQQHKGK